MAAMAEIDRLRALLAATTAMLRAELTALDEAGASFHPAPGEWCAKEVVGHLVEADQRGFAGRVTDILRGRTDLGAWDQARVAAARRDCDRPWMELLAEFGSGRDYGLAVLAGIGDGDLDRSGQHREVGKLTVRDVIHEWPFHDRDHLQQLLENTRALLWPDLGGAQRFTELHGQRPPHT